MTTTTELRNAYRWHHARAMYIRDCLRDVDAPDRNGMSAALALELARGDVAAGKTRYPNSARHAALGAPFAGYGTKAMRWCESPADIGLRFVGYADKLARIDHTGWFTDSFQDSKVRGVVYQLSARNGRPVYVSGYDNADNGAADNGGPAAIDFGTLWEGEPGGEEYPDSDHYGAHRDAANHADSMAQRAAETEREYQTAWQAGSMWAELGEQISKLRRKTLAMLAERRQAKAAGAAYPALCAALDDSVTEMLEHIADARKERRDLAAGQYQSGRDYFGFYTGDSTLRDAFNEGAGEAVLA